MIETAVQVEAPWNDNVDWEALAGDAVLAAFRVSPYGPLAGDSVAVEISVRYADDEEVRQLNASYRGKDKPTNVLSFPMLEREDLLGLPADGPPELLGDIALALETCAREAADKGLPLEHHATHLIVHGLLHLAGHDHEISPEDARTMELLEIKALAQLGIADPYGDH